MQIVIDIPEEVKRNVRAYGLSLCPRDKEQLIHAIKNGTTLPKGHGRLIDEDEIAGDGSWDFADRLDATPTIIEADKE